MTEWMAESGASAASRRRCSASTMRCTRGWKRKKLWGGAGKPLRGPSNSTRKREPPRRSKASAWEYRRASICEYRKTSVCEYRKDSACESCYHILFCPRNVSEGCVRVRCPQNVIIIINATMLIAIRQTNPMRIMHQGYTKAQGACLGRNPPPIVRLRPAFFRGSDQQVLRFYKAPICQQWQLRPSV